MSEMKAFLNKDQELIEKIRTTLNSVSTDFILLNMDVVEVETLQTFLAADMDHLDQFLRAAINVSNVIHFKISTLNKISQ